ncbi:TPA: HK97 gp10 family phage protein [Clostridioides difficile]|uniref:HK97-gp10 family putative phage morphogenesis protein n=1 Tax=unclassified Clostridioides TaxID=2635829 RepID=UPI000BB17F4B|nr:HK97 gp10 family phage protein [Clostridioides difficile]MCC0637526.1 HK97 gp10 family phage protein [Clostridioides sp. ES-S-0001-02]MCC0706985.1 HK97 gp10 family phage protein [Clostridioides sp. ES-S-0190-01]MDI6118420.1 HK97 gp10 family phage protein [Clostridioides difficile]MDI6219275.1 HK97 gp10 family phage protein [Clostridioides difficile]
MGLEWNGFNTVQAKLDELGKKAGKEITTKALDEGANVILNGQKQTVPVDTGNLKSKLGKFDFKGSGSNARVDVGISNNEDRAATYGYIQEYGRTKMNGKKWMKRAWENTIKEANETIKESLIKNLLK